MIFFEGLENLAGEGGNLFVGARRIEGDVDLASFADRADVGLEMLPDFERGGGAVAVKKATVGILDNRVVAERSAACDEDVDGLAGLVIGRFAAKVTIQTGAGDDAVARLIEVNEDDNFLADPWWFGHLAEGEKQVFGETPVEEGADVAVDADNLERGEFAYFSERRFGGRDEAVFGIEIDENVEEVFRLEIARDEFARQKNFAEFTAIEIKAGLRGADNFQGVSFADGGHQVFPFIGRRSEIKEILTRR